MLIKVKVHPGAGREKIVKRSQNEFEVWLRQKAERGEANRRLFKLLDSYFPDSRVLLKKGAKKRNKIMEIRKKEG